MRIIFPLFMLLFALGANAQLVANKNESQKIEKSTPDTIRIYHDSGIPWNRENFDPNTLVRHHSFDPAISIGYTYSISFLSTPLGNISQTSYIAHLDYEIFPELHLYSNFGLWMPLYSNIYTPYGFAREDIRQGNVDFVIPDIGVEYKPSENTTIRFFIVNETDALKAYGPWRSLYAPYNSRRNSTF